MARSIAPKFTPLAAIRPMPSVVPWASDAGGIRCVVGRIGFGEVDDRRAAHRAR